MDYSLADITSREVCIVGKICKVRFKVSVKKYVKMVKYGLLYGWFNIRRSLYTFMIDNILLRTLWPEISSKGQIWTSIWLMKHQKESMSMYRKPKFEDSLARNTFLGSKMDFCMADLTSGGVNDYIWKGQVSSTPWPEICSVGQLWTIILSMNYLWTWTFYT